MSTSFDLVFSILSQLTVAVPVFLIEFVQICRSTYFWPGVSSSSNSSFHPIHPVLPAIYLSFSYLSYPRLPCNIMLYCLSSNLFFFYSMVLYLSWLTLAFHWVGVGADLDHNTCPHIVAMNMKEVCMCKCPDYAHKLVAKFPNLLLCRQAF